MPAAAPAAGLSGLKPAGLTGDGAAGPSFAGLAEADDGGLTLSHGEVAAEAADVVIEAPAGRPEEPDDAGFVWSDGEALAAVSGADSDDRSARSPLLPLSAP